MSNMEPSPNPILIVGAGHVGMVLADALLRLPIPTLLFGTNPANETNCFPKMGLTNYRSMELLCSLSLADAYRSLEGAVSTNERFESIFVTSLAPEGKELGRVNDGTYPVEPEQRWCILQDKNIGFRGGWRYILHFEQDNKVSASAVKRNADIGMVGGYSDTFTAHYPLLPLATTSPITPHEAPSFSIAYSYISSSGRVLLTGDAARRLAAVTKGYGRNLLLESYSLERRPMMMRALCRSHRHLQEHVQLGQMYQANWEALNEDSDRGKKVRGHLGKFIEDSGPDTLDKGIELDLRYDFSPCIVPDAHTLKNTKPSHRAPHIFLSDGKTSIYNMFGPEWKLIHFTNSSSSSFHDTKKANTLLSAAKTLSFPLKHVLLCNESHARKFWERDLVLVRPG
ncbi:hypothetical protein BDV06DRAFT_233394 [Aspergillus oleicola]